MVREKDGELGAGRFVGYTVTMPNRSSKKPKRPRDANQLAKQIVNEATGQVEEQPDNQPQKDPAAVELGRKGGLKGGKARAAKLTPEQRSEIAKKAARKRWGGSI